MSEQYTSTENNTSVDAFMGTSAIQHTEPDAALLRKSHDTANADGIAPADLSSTNVSSIFWAMQTVRTHGFTARNFGFPGLQVFQNSQVSVTMTEVDNNGRPFLGPATMQVYNVVPSPMPENDGTITVRYNVDWSDDLNIRFNFIIVN
jgi:hypothetical protein